MANEGKYIVLLPGERETISMPGNQVSFVHREPDGAFSMVEWSLEPWAAGSSIHIHRKTDEAFYVLAGTIGFQLGEETVEGPAGAFVSASKGTVHGFYEKALFVKGDLATDRYVANATALPFARYASIRTFGELTLWWLGA